MFTLSKLERTRARDTECNGLKITELAQLFTSRRQILWTLHCSCFCQMRQPSVLDAYCKCWLITVEGCTCSKHSIFQWQKSLYTPKILSLSQVLIGISKYSISPHGLSPTSSTQFAIAQQNSSGTRVSGAKLTENLGCHNIFEGVLN